MSLMEVYSRLQTLDNVRRPFVPFLNHQMIIHINNYEYLLKRFQNETLRILAESTKLILNCIKCHWNAVSLVT